MTQAEIIIKTQAFLEDKFSTESSGHDYWHMYRTWQLSKCIAANEPGADMFIVELAARRLEIPRRGRRGGSTSSPAFSFI